MKLHEETVVLVLQAAITMVATAAVMALALGLIQWSWWWLALVVCWPGVSEKKDSTRGH